VITRKLPAPRGLLLDAMGTLIGLRESVGVTYARLAATHGLNLNPQRIEQGFHQAYRDAPPLAFPGLTGPELHRAELAWWCERIHSSLKAAGAQTVPEPLGEALFNHYADAAAWQVYADVACQLQRWWEQGLKLAVVSNFDSRLPGLLEQLELSPLLRAVVVSSSAGVAKPDPAPFQIALEQLQLDASQVWHVGDSPDDVAGAAAAGLPCIQVRRS
jgi:putative hydrolase of the HAD superfamily